MSFALCRGILWGPISGLAIAELLLNGKAESIDLTPFDPARFLIRRARKSKAVSTSCEQDDAKKRSRKRVKTNQEPKSTA